MPQRLLTVLLLAATLLSLPALADDHPPLGPVDEAILKLPADLQTLPRIGQHQPPAPDPTLGDRLDDVINPINSVVAQTLFFDIAFGSLRSQDTDDAGQPKFAQDPVLEDATTTYTALLVDDKGLPQLDDQNNPKTVTVNPGDKIQPLDESGIPKTTQGDPVIVGPKLPFLVVWLGAGAIFFTFYHGWINLRGMPHAIAIVRGKFSKPGDDGEIAPFQALTSALSATVGLGNIAGVALAMVAGGPGALFWMMFLGLFGMTAKFHESTLAQLYRKHNADGTISGGPMYFLSQGLKEINPSLAGLGKVLAVVFAVFLMAAALGGGNMFQSNQAFEGFFSQFIQPGIAPEEVEGVRNATSIGFGIVMAVVVGVVVIGGITRIGKATSLLVPVMAVVYVAACLVIIAMNITEVPGLIGKVFTQAFGVDSMAGGLLGVLIIGFQRAAFSSESGIGSSAVAHAAAKTDEPVREGFVASLEPFIDTIIICFMTGMVVLITGAYQQDELGGTAVTLEAFKTASAFGGVFPYILSISVILFAFSTMIAWCYYGERAWGYLFGIKTVLVFRLVFVTCVFIGAVASLGAVLDTADLMLLSCALPNILGGIILAPKVKKQLQSYWSRYKSGEMSSATTDPQ
ncbi:MAG: alanine/glycine:cation symporter family protein [Planctomycetota bacterium]